LTWWTEGDLACNTGAKRKKAPRVLTAEVLTAEQEKKLRDKKLLRQLLRKEKLFQTPYTTWAWLD